jgi:hypothetical protein
MLVVRKDIHFSSGKEKKARRREEDWPGISPSRRKVSTEVVENTLKDGSQYIISIWD